MLKILSANPFLGTIAQLVEQWTFNPQVIGSNPVGSIGVNPLLVDTKLIQIPFLSSPTRN